MIMKPATVQSRSTGMHKTCPTHVITRGWNFLDGFSVHADTVLLDAIVDCAARRSRDVAGDAVLATFVRLIIEGRR